MTAPSRKVRGWTYLRDGFRCVNCGRTDHLEWNHRESSGHGGRGVKAPALITADGVTACTFCNSAFEHELQDLALAMGWKIRRNRKMHAAEIPFFDKNVRTWFLPFAPRAGVPDGPYRLEIDADRAVVLLAAAGNLIRKGAA